MELKEIEKRLKIFFGDNTIGIESAMVFIEAYGNNCYNQALEDAVKSVSCKRYQNDESGAEINITLTDNYFDSHDGYSYEADKQSILNLKKH